MKKRYQSTWGFLVTISITFGLSGCSDAKTTPPEKDPSETVTKRESAGRDHGKKNDSQSDEELSLKNKTTDRTVHNGLQTKIQNLPKILKPMPVPKLSTPKPSTEVSVVKKNNSDKFPLAWSGIIHLKRGGYFRVEVDFDEITKNKDSLDHTAYYNRYRKNYWEQFVKQGGMNYTGALFLSLHASHPEKISKVSGKLRLYRLEDKEILDTSDFDGWVDNDYRIFSLKSQRWQQGKDSFLRNFLSRLNLSGYWLTKEHSLKGWVNSEWNHFHLTDQKNVSEKLVQLASVEIDRQKNKGRVQVGINSKEYNKLVKMMRDPKLNIRTRSLIKKKMRELQKQIRSTNNSLPTETIDQQKAYLWYQELISQLDPNELNSWKVGDEYYRVLSMFSGPEFKKAFQKSYYDLTYSEQEAIRLFFGRADRKKMPKASYIDSLFLFSNRTTALSFLSLAHAKNSWFRDFQKRFLSQETYPGDPSSFEKIYPWALIALEGRTSQTKKNDKEQLAVSRDKFSKQARDYKTKDHRHALYAKLMNEFQKYVAVPDNADALEYVGNWNRNFAIDYRDLQHTNKSDYDAVNEFAQKRYQRLLATYFPVVIDRLKSCTDVEKIKQIQNWALYYDPKGTTAIGKTIIESISLNLKRIEFEQKLALFSTQEQKYMKPGTTTIVVPTVIPEPTEESIRMALLREIAINFEKGKQVSPYASTYTESTRGGRMLGIYFKMTIQKIKIMKGAKGQTSLKEKSGGYVCFYKSKVHMTAYFKKGTISNKSKVDVEYNSAQMKIMNELLKIASLKKVHADRFLFTKDGWRSPSTARRSKKAILSNLSGRADNSRDPFARERREYFGK